MHYNTQGGNMNATKKTGWIARVLLAAAVVVALSAGTASAQNEGRVSVGAGIDFVTSYYFRGIVQETGGFIAQPYLEAGLSLYEGDNGSVSLAAGTWNSLHSRTDAGFPGAAGIYYENDFYAGLGLGFAGGWGADVTFTSYMSPRGSWGTVKELAVGLSHDDIIAPYITLAFEIDGSAAGDNEGTYLELGIEPSLPLDDAPVSVSFPVAIGLSPSDYYDPGGVNEAYGFFNVGAMLGVPLSGIPAEWGSWELTAGVQLLFMGDALKTINGTDDDVEPIAIFGLSLGY